MKLLPCFLLGACFSTCFAQVQIPIEKEPRTSASQPVPWSQSGLLLRKTEASPESIRLLQEAARANDTNALLQLAAISASDMDAFEYVRRAAELGDPLAEYELAVMYAQGRGTSADMEKALWWGRKSAEGGNLAAQVSLAHSLLMGTSAESKPEGLEWLKRASASGYSPATVSLARLYALGDLGIPPDEHQAEMILLPAAEKGDPECQFALASLYQQGKTMAEKRELALVWLRKASENGHPDAGRILDGIQTGDQAPSNTAP